MAVRDIVVWPDTRLRAETRTISAITDEVRALYRDLTDSMFAYDGIGIAAVQIGVPEKMFLLEARLLGGAETDEPVAFINPEITWLSDDEEEAEEGCLSFPGIYVPIARSLRCKVKSMGIDGQITEREVEGLTARAVQHEFDHLTGKLMVDFVGPLKKQMIKRKLKQNAETPKVGAK